jgi:hypothetical protein
MRRVEREKGVERIGTEKKKNGNGGRKYENRMRFKRARREESIDSQQGCGGGGGSEGWNAI